MIIESLVAHLIGYFYFQPTQSNEASDRKAIVQPFHYLWGVVFTTFVIIGLNDFTSDFLMNWLVMVFGLMVGYIFYENKLKRGITFFLNSNLNAEHSLHLFYNKNRSIVEFVVHQMIYLLWILILNALVDMAFHPLILIGMVFVFFILLLGSLFALNSSQHLSRYQGSEFLKQASTYLVLSGITLVILQLALEALAVVQGSDLPLSAFVVQTSYAVLIRLSLVLLLLMKPTNLIIRAISSKYDPKIATTIAAHSEQDSGFKGAGAMIGNLERLLILLSFFFGSLLSVVAILSIKAFARYKLITEDPYFSEYFVIGTMLSVLITFACYALLVLMLI
ncbi:hypothetical protein [Alkalibacterium sp. 20]|uniref:hypothetical protein n=1 Tax=Alkalibacterium sp. 20 TaxID=1798803 RepID=UPI000900119E|nr:hypothetical protein [Alkalibacterium sp. 20]OJF97007.1 hypothetical protein AX762_00120 [Alkalibacterium sp. 20]